MCTWKNDNYEILFIMCVYFVIPEILGETNVDTGKKKL